MSRRVLVTREEPEPLSGLLRSGGADPVHVALIGLIASGQPPPPGRPQAALLTSAAACATAAPLRAILGEVPVVAVGPATARAAVAAGLRVAAVGSAGGAEAVALVEALAPGQWWHVGGAELSRHLEAAMAPLGAPRWVVYERVALDARAALALALPVAVICLASGSAARAFAAQATPGAARVAVIGESTADEARLAGLPVHRIAREPSLAALAEAALALLDPL